MKIIFLDIDGVLNGHEWCHTGEGPRIDSQCARYLEIIVERTGAKIVLISSWRSWINNGLMTPKGFSKVLLSHGCKADVIDALPAKDPDLDHAEDRMIKILDWVQENKPKAYVVLDNLPLRVPNLVRTNPGRGLIPVDITNAVKLLGGWPLEEK